MPDTGVAFSVLRTEFYARGFQDFPDSAADIARADRWLNQAHASVCLAEQWPFRLTTVAGTAPLTIADLGKVLTVVDTTRNDWLLEETTEIDVTPLRLASTGGPWFWYRDELVIRTWPVSTNNLSVRHYKRPAKLVNDADLTLVPERWMDVIVNHAVVRGHADNADAGAVALIRQECDNGLAEMRDDLLDAPRGIRRVAVHEDA